jgi:hypothetical protein
MCILNGAGILAGATPAREERWRFFELRPLPGEYTNEQPVMSELRTQAQGSSGRAAGRGTARPTAGRFRSTGTVRASRSGLSSGWWCPTGGTPPGVRCGSTASAASTGHAPTRSAHWNASAGSSRVRRNATSTASGAVFLSRGRQLKPSGELLLPLRPLCGRNTRRAWSATYGRTTGLAGNAARGGRKAK